MTKYPTRDAILAELEYHAPTGRFGRKRLNGPALRSGTCKNGYWFDSVGGRQYPRSVLVWIVETGEPPAWRLRHTEGGLCTRKDTLQPIIPQTPWDEGRDRPAVKRYWRWCKARGIKPNSDGMAARLLDPGT